MAWKSFKYYGILALMSLCLELNVFGIAGYSLRLQVLSNASDLVVVGRTSSFTKVGQVPMTIGPSTLPADIMEFSVEIVDILKGNETVEKIRVQVPVLQPPGGTVLLDGVPENSVRLLFLRKLSDHLYQVTDPHHPSLPGIAVSTNSSDPLEAIATVECQVMSNDSSELNDRLDAMWSLHHINASCIVPPLTAIASQGSPVLSVTAEDELVKRGDTAILKQAIADALSSDGDSTDYLRENILSSIGAAKFDPTAVPLLAPLIDSSRVEARVSAAYALKNIGIRACTASLLSLLKDRDQRVRYVATTALADIYNMPHLHPSVPEFGRNENRYTSVWFSDESPAKQNP